MWFWHPACRALSGCSIFEMLFWLRVQCVRVDCWRRIGAWNVVHPASPAPRLALMRLCCCARILDRCDAGFSLMDATKAAATDSGNLYGTPGKPWKTIPTQLPAGAVVELDGTCGAPRIPARSDDRGAGNECEAVYICGVRIMKPILLCGGDGKSSGTYGIIENIEVRARCPISRRWGGLLFLLPRAISLFVINDMARARPPTAGLGVLNWEGA